MQHLLSAVILAGTLTVFSGVRVPPNSIHRSKAAVRQFERATGYPHGRPGYVVDHVWPLLCGGKDAPENMQWQTVEEAKVKDKWERAACGR